MERFLRTELIIGKESVNLLGKMHVTIVGVGAVGSFAMEALARAGVGKFTLIDFDDIEVSNINRQLLALESTLAQSKVSVAKKRILDINPNAQVEIVEDFFSADKAAIMIPQHTQYVVDAIDSLNPKVDLIEYLVCSKIAFISSMGAALRTDFFSIKKGDLFDTKNCPLARFVRKRLRRRGISKGVLCIYSDQRKKLNALDEGSRVLARGRERSPLGSLVTITGAFGLAIAHEVLDSLVGL